jgi:amidohydrolase
METDWLKIAQSLRPELVARRRDLHQHPEIAFEEFRTAGIVAAELGALGLEVMTGVGKTGVVGILEGAYDGPTILVRADMDALPVLENTSHGFASQNGGKMHACGHDGHTSIALTVAKMLAERRDHMAGRVKFVFQPAEELALGANAMIADGVLNDPVPSIALGLHLWSDLPTGQVALSEGPVMAGANDFRIVIQGSGGHGAMPEQAIDPLAAGAQMVTALNGIVSRNLSANDTGVISVCAFKSGDASNVVPDQAELAGTYRTYRNQVTDLLEKRMREVVNGVAAAMGCQATLTMNRLTPPLNNDSQVTQQARRAFAAYQGDLRFIDTLRLMVSEDMACFLEQVPGLFFFVGSAKPGVQNYPHHHPQFDVDEDALPIAAGLLATAVAQYVFPKNN